MLYIIYLFSIDFDKDQDFFAVGGVTRQLKVYEYNSVVTRPVSVHYPVQDMGCASKIRYALYRIDINSIQHCALSEAFNYKHACYFMICSIKIVTSQAKTSIVCTSDYGHSMAYKIC